MGRRGYSGSKDPIGLYGAGYDERIDAKVRQRVTFNHFCEFLYLLAVGRFKWDNLPSSCDERMLEQSLILHGSCLFFRHPVTGDFLTLPSANAGKFDIYNIPLKRVVSRPNGYHATFNGLDDDNVLIYNDATLMPFISTIWYYAQKMTRIEIAKDVNTMLQMRPKAIRGSADMVKSIREAIFNAQLGVPYVIADGKGLQLDSKASVLDFDTPIILEDLEKEKNCLFSEYLTRLGYNNINIYKNEHLTVDESNANNEHIISFRNSALQMREKACDKINALFGLSVKVEFNANNALINDFHSHVSGADGGAAGDEDDN